MSNYPDTKCLTLEHSRGWLTIWLDRPEARNAMSRTMTAELTSILETAHEDRELRGITLRGAGGWFCAGGDLQEFRADFQSGPPDSADIEAASRAAGTLFDLLNRMPQVTVALVEGGAMAGGLGLVCACDISVAVRNARFALTETTLGIPPAQIAPFVRSRVGLAAARRMMLTALRFDAEAAVQLGLVSEIVEKAADFDKVEAELRAGVLRCAPGANAVTKDILLSADMTKDLRETAARSFADCMLSDEGREGVAAFLEKRKPAWVLT